MARPASNNPKISKHISLSVENVARMELELYSDLEGRVPVGAQGLLVDRLLTEHFKRLDILNAVGTETGRMSSDQLHISQVPRG